MTQLWLSSSSTIDPSVNGMDHQFLKGMDVRLIRNNRGHGTPMVNLAAKPKSITMPHEGRRSYEQWMSLHISLLLFRQQPASLRTPHVTALS